MTHSLLTPQAPDSVLVKTQSTGAVEIISEVQRLDLLTALRVLQNHDRHLQVNGESVSGFPTHSPEGLAYQLKCRGSDLLPPMVYFRIVNDVSRELRRITGGASDLSSEARTYPLGKKKS